MKLILDCGSTKCATILLDDHQNHISSSLLIGYNPLLHKDITTSIFNHFSEIQKHYKNLDELIYCGAGCIDPDINKKVKEGLQNLFPKPKIWVYSDLEFIGQILNINSESIIAIIGTGSNAGLWNGHKIFQNTASGGYLLGDEGSGYALGRSLLINYLRYNFLPHTQHILKMKIDLAYHELMKIIYTDPTPNKYIASYAVLFRDIEDPLKDKILNDNFNEFIFNRILPLKRNSNIIHIFGSISFFNIEYLKPLLEKVNLEIGIMARNPLDPLKRNLS